MNQAIQRILSRITPEQREKWRAERAAFDAEVEAAGGFDAWEKQCNMRLSNDMYDIGCKLIGTSQMYGFDVYIFETSEEASKAFQEFEVNQKRVSAFFHSREQHQKACEEYENEIGSPPETKWF